MITTRRAMLIRTASLVAGSLLPWPIARALAQATQSELEPADPAQPGRDPAVDTSLARQIAPGVTIIPDRRIDLVPNIGIIEGRDAVLVVDTGIGLTNGQRVMELARDIAAGRPIHLTLTHFHPEHGYGAQAFKGEAQIIYNESQAEELNEKGREYLELFRTFGPAVEKALEGVQIVGPDQTYTGETAVDLGDRQVIMREMPAHTRGDQIVYLPEEEIVFTGDLVEDRFFPIFPDSDAKGGQWIEVLKQLEALEPEIVVPGHGAVGSVALVEHLRRYLELVQNETRALAEGGGEVEEIDQRLTPLVKARYPAWDNELWIAFAIRVFYAEATGKELELPQL